MGLSGNSGLPPTEQETPSLIQGLTENNNQAEKGLNAEMKRQTGESQAAYLERSNGVITNMLQITRGGKLFDPIRLKDGDLTNDETAFIEQVMAEICQETVGVGEKSDPALVLKVIEQSIGLHSFPSHAAKPGLTKEAAFDKTARNRKLFEKQPAGSIHRESYWNTLVSPYVTPEVAKTMLDNKTILLLGGGRSHLKAEMVQHGIVPREVINVDPYISVSWPGEDPVTPFSATDTDLVQKLTAKDTKKVDEIWATYSVPAYLEDPAEIRQLFTNIDGLLADGGTARIWPTQVSDSGNEMENLARKAALIESLQKLAASGKYEIIFRVAAGRPGFTLFKLPLWNLRRSPLPPAR